MDTAGSAAQIEQGLAHAIALVNGGERAAARALCTELLARHGGHPALHQLLARLCLDDGDAPAAIRHIAHSLRERPGHAPSRQLAAQAWYELGRSQRDGGDPAAARAAWQQAVALHPALAPAWFALSLVHEDLGEPAEARAALERVVQLDPGHAEAHVNLGVLAQRRGDVDAAMAHYAGAWRARPDTLGRIAHALSAEPHGRLWLQLDDLKRELAALSPGA